MTADLIPIRPEAVAARAPKPRRAGDELPEYVRHHEIVHALEFMSGRPRAFLRFLWLTGARVSEALSVRVVDVDMSASAVRLDTLKRRRGRPQRVIPLPGDFLGELAVIIAGARLERDARPFPWSRSRAFEIVRDALVVAGVDRPRAHPHAVRHGHAIHALRSGVPLPSLQRVLGHRFISSTQVYLRVTGDDVRADYERVKW